MASSLVGTVQPAESAAMAASLSAGRSNSARVTASASAGRPALSWRRTSWGRAGSSSGNQSRPAPDRPAPETPPGDLVFPLHALELTHRHDGGGHLPCHQLLDEPVQRKAGELHGGEEVLQPDSLFASLETIGEVAAEGVLRNGDDRLPLEVTPVSVGAWAGTTRAAPMARLSPPAGLLRVASQASGYWRARLTDWPGLVMTKSRCSRATASASSSSPSGCSTKRWPGTRCASQRSSGCHWLWPGPGRGSPARRCVSARPRPAPAWPGMGWIPVGPALAQRGAGRPAPVTAGLTGRARAAG